MPLLLKRGLGFLKLECNWKTCPFWYCKKKKKTLGSILKILLWFDQCDGGAKLKWLFGPRPIIVGPTPIHQIPTDFEEWNSSQITDTGWVGCYPNLVDWCLTDELCALMWTGLLTRCSEANQDSEFCPQMVDPDCTTWPNPILVEAGIKMGRVQHVTCLNVGFVVVVMGSGQWYRFIDFDPKSDWRWVGVSIVPTYPPGIKVHEASKAKIQPIEGWTHTGTSGPGPLTAPDVDLFGCS